MVMPKKNGKESLRHIREIKSDVKCIFLSGNAGDIIRKQVHETEVLFISKPVSPTNLFKTVREMLDNESKIMTDIVS